jgi:hypothetical protein
MNDEVWCVFRISQGWHVAFQLTAKTEIKIKREIALCAVQCYCCHRQTIAMKVDQSKKEKEKEKENFEFQK